MAFWFAEKHFSNIESSYGNKNVKYEVYERALDYYETFKCRYEATLNQGKELDRIFEVCVKYKNGYTNKNAKKKIYD